MYKKYLVVSVIGLVVLAFLYFVNFLIYIPVREKEERDRITLQKSKTGIDETGYGHLPLILNRRESCVICHGDIKGIEESHSPEKIGCFSCHLGNRLAENKAEAHKGMILIPGNMSNVSKTCGTIECHPQMSPRMQNNIMNSMNGVVAVDKWVFNETESPDKKVPVDSIKFTEAETHLRNLCASCHLSNEKTEPGSIGELSRGGGCLACHLNYTKESLTAIKDYRNKVITSSHPGVSIKMNNDQCFGCHSRSGRISLSYDGWHETQFTADQVKDKSGYRLLQDGRIVKKIQADIHSEKGMLCVDCHNSHEVMGDGSYALHKEEQIKIECTDCHYVNNPSLKKYSSFYEEEKKIAVLRGVADNNRVFLSSPSTGLPLLNTFYRDGKAYLKKKSSGEVLSIRPAALECTVTAHKNLSCSSCHSSWSPQCIGCHTEYNPSGSMYDLLSNSDRNGEWVETSNDFLAESAVLGIKETKVNGIIKKTVQEFIPGMVLSVKKDNGKEIHKRLFAPAFSHTIRKEARTCISCHNNPQALGYGRGKLQYEIKNNAGSWKFFPIYPISKQDGLPQDAWIGFLKERGYNSTTRSNLRPFSIEEQKTILFVGACLTCHKPDSKVMKQALVDFNSTVLRRKKNCITP